MFHSLMMEGIYLCICYLSLISVSRNFDIVYIQKKHSQTITFIVLYSIHSLMYIQRHFQQYFTYIVAVSFMGGGNWSLLLNYEPIG